jgi:hypothetical protein
LVAVKLAVEAALVAVVADAGSERFHSDEKGIIIAIGGNLLDDQPVA